jgi:hypothetical protein
MRWAKDLIRMGYYIYMSYIHVSSHRLYVNVNLFTRHAGGGEMCYLRLSPYERKAWSYYFKNTILNRHLQH